MGAESTIQPHVAVIDSGITAEIRSDGWLTDVVRHDGSAGGDDASNIDPLSYLDDDTDRLEFSAGHGTFVAGIVAQVCPTAHISVLRAVPADGVGTELDVARAMVRAAEGGAQILNLSLGHQSERDEPSIAMAAAVARIHEIEQERGEEIVIIAAAGNFGDERPTWPAALPDVIAVGSVDTDLRTSAWSSRGPWVDVATVGRGVLSTYVEGQSYDEAGDVVDRFGESAFARWTGTSFAAPQVAGAVAQEMVRARVGARTALQTVLAGAVRVGGEGTPVLTVLTGV
jgi:subtilisin family serine protease